MCKKCKCPKDFVKKVDQSLNGVKVIVHRFYDSAGVFQGTSVEADCQCFGTYFRCHSNPNCPVRQKILAEETKLSAAESLKRRMDAKYFPF